MRKKKPDVPCLNCGKMIRYCSTYCDNQCQQDFQYRQSILNWETVEPGYEAIRRWLKEEFGDVCSVCGISSWNDRVIVLDLEHKDGNSCNNSKENVCLICPNCHSQTDTYKGRNKGSGRHFRKIRYQSGKSYWWVTTSCMMWMGKLCFSVRFAKRWQSSWAHMWVNAVTGSSRCRCGWPAGLGVSMGWPERGNI